jgi:hypothetical protein
MSKRHHDNRQFLISRHHAPLSAMRCGAFYLPVVFLKAALNRMEHTAHQAGDHGAIEAALRRLVTLPRYMLTSTTQDEEGSHETDSYLR